MHMQGVLEGPAPGRGEENLAEVRATERFPHWMVRTTDTSLP